MARQFPMGVSNNPAKQLDVAYAATWTELPDHT